MEKMVLKHVEKKFHFYTFIKYNLSISFPLLTFFFLKSIWVGDN